MTAGHIHSLNFSICEGDMQSLRYALGQIVPNAIQLRLGRFPMVLRTGMWNAHGIESSIVIESTVRNAFERQWSLPNLITSHAP
jgi:hypothetical protein